MASSVNCTATTSQVDRLASVRAHTALYYQPVCGTCVSEGREKEKGKNLRCCYDPNTDPISAQYRVQATPFVLIRLFTLQCHVHGRTQQQLPPPRHRILDVSDINDKKACLMKQP